MNMYEIEPDAAALLRSADVGSTDNVLRLSIAISLKRIADVMSDEKSESRLSANLEKFGGVRVAVQKGMQIWARPTMDCRSGELVVVEVDDAPSK